MKPLTEKRGGKMNKGDLIASIAELNDMSKAEAGRVLNALLARMAGAMSKGHHVKIAGFGSFRVTERAAQKGRNPQTGQRLEIPAHYVVKFKAGRQLFDRVQ